MRLSSGPRERRQRVRGSDLPRRCDRRPGIGAALAHEVQPVPTAMTIAAQALTVFKASAPKFVPALEETRAAPSTRDSAKGPTVHSTQTSLVTRLDSACPLAIRPMTQL